MASGAEEYRTRKATLDSARQRVEGMIAGLRAVAVPLLDNWEGCYLEGIPGQNSIPASLLRGGDRRSVDIRKLPNFARLQEALAQYAEAAKSAGDCYDALPQEFRTGFEPPTQPRPPSPTESRRVGRKPK